MFVSIHNELKIHPRQQHNVVSYIWFMWITRCGPDLGRHYVAVWDFEFQFSSCNLNQNGRHDAELLFKFKAELTEIPRNLYNF